MWRSWIARARETGARVSSRWRDTLTIEDWVRYERIAVEQLGESCARWLATGERGD